ncbi:hypothetical protein [Mesotoga sp. UBA6090]|uniref:hypothetical protein n=1 Tax=Mesotoga sp. UBA6090 TaxID=1946860 RepID=UPI0025E6E295|nr:hypothetical protein [Mesotoga sp. UBA6090]
MKSLERFALTENYSSEDLLWALRNYQSIWSRILETQVTLTFKDGDIDFESPPKTINYSKDTLRGCIQTKRMADGQKAVLIIAAMKLDAMLKSLTDKQREVVFWRLIDRSHTVVRNQKRYASTRELAEMLSIPNSTFRDRLISAWEKLGGEWELLRDYIQYAIENSC